MSEWCQYQPRCDMCGRFIAAGAPGVSWSQSWSYDMSGTPDLHDEELRCSPCTDIHGIKPTNCNETGGKYHGRNPEARAAASTSQEKEGEEGS
jgi:hypothetical protein